MTIKNTKITLATAVLAFAMSYGTDPGHAEDTKTNANVWGCAYEFEIDHAWELSQAGLTDAQVQSQTHCVALPKGLTGKLVKKVSTSVEVAFEYGADKVILLWVKDAHLNLASTSGPAPVQAAPVTSIWPKSSEEEAERSAWAASVLDKWEKSDPVE